MYDMAKHMIHTSSHLKEHFQAAGYLSHHGLPSHTEAEITETSFLVVRGLQCNICGEHEIHTDATCGFRERIMLEHIAFKHHKINEVLMKCNLLPLDLEL